jgi:hypothetical protein
MSGAVLDLDTLATDPESLAKAFEQIESGEDPTPKEPDPEAKQEQDGKAAQSDPKVDQEAKAADPETEPAGVATKDGKHVIPYSVLKGERDRASRAEQMAREMQEKVAALEAQVAAGAKPGDSARTEPETPAVGDLSPEDLEVLKEDFPTVYKAVMASMAAARALEAKLKPVEETVQQTEAERQRSAAETVQEAIDSVPKLAHIQATNPEAFDLARQFDAAIRGRPEWATKTLTERFAKVAEMVEAAVGPIDLPASPKTSRDAVDMRQAAKAKAEEAAKSTRTNVPTSLSEFPAGQHAAQDEREAAETLSPLQLAEKFASMTPDQMDAYFRNL